MGKINPVKPVEAARLCVQLSLAARLTNYKQQHAWIKDILNSEHLLTYSALNEENTEYEFMNILQGTMKQKVMILKKIQQNKENKKKITNSRIK